MMNAREFKQKTGIDSSDAIQIAVLIIVVAVVLIHIIIPSFYHGWTARIIDRLPGGPRP